MHNRCSIAVLALLGIAGCPTRQKFDELPTLTLTSPINDTYAKRTVVITVQVGGDLDVPVVLWANQSQIGTARAPQYRFDWDTASVLEAPYDLVAEAVIGGQIVRSPPVRVTVDRTPPTVVSRTILQHDGGAKLSAPIKVTFSETMAPASITPASISLAADGATVPTSVSLSGDGKSASIKITDRSALTLPAAFTGTFAAGMTDLAGNDLVIPSVPWTWIAPPLFNYGLMLNNPVSVPSVAVGPDLEPTIVYPAYVPNTMMRTSLRVLTAGGTQGWIELPPPTSREFGTELRPSIVLDGQGRPVVVWQEDGGLRAAFWKGASWDTPLPPLDGDGNASTVVMGPPRLALGPADQLYVAWTEDI